MVNNKIFRDLGFSEEWIAQLQANELCVFQEPNVYEFEQIITEDTTDLIINSEDSLFSSDLIL